VALAMNAAVGAWSGVIAIANGPVATPIAVPAVLVAVSIGVTSSEAPLAT
jgi:hypothetical protein